MPKKGRKSFTLDEAEEFVRSLARPSKALLSLRPTRVIFWRGTRDRFSHMR